MEMYTYICIEAVLYSEIKFNKKVVTETTTVSNQKETLSKNIIWVVALLKNLILVVVMKFYSDVL